MPPDEPELPVGVSAIFRDEIDSTNTEAARLAGAGTTGPVWVYAGRQTRGRGRQDRSWISEPGNLYASLLFVPDGAMTALHQLSLVAGIAVVDAVRDLDGTSSSLSSLRLKWPNDVLIGTAKLAGILSESLTTGGGRPTLAIVGIGINLAHRPEALGRDTASLAGVGLHVTPAAMLGKLARRMDGWLSVWEGGKGFQQIRAAWLERAGALGEGMTINTGAGQKAGRFDGMDFDGALLLRDTAGEQARYTFGDVALVPRAESK